MSTTTVNLGMLPNNRGSYTSETWAQNPPTIYKDNIVEFNNSAYIYSPVSFSIDNPAASATNEPPYDAATPTVLNTGWYVFASGNNTFTTGEKVDNVGIDAKPTAGSENLVKSGGVEEQINKINKNDFIKVLQGAGESLVRSSKCYVKPGVQYKITIKNPNISVEGITAVDSKVRFAIRPYDSNGERVGTTDIISVTFNNLTPLQESYVFTVPNNTHTIEVLMRAAENAEQICWIEDIDYAHNGILTIKTLINEGYLYRGIATPSITPDTIYGKVFYLALTPGTYTNFNNFAVHDGQVKLFSWNGSRWNETITGLSGIRDINGIKNVARLITSSTSGNIAEKEITQSEYVPIYNGCQKLIQFSNVNTADDCTLSINGETPKPLFLNNVRVSSSNPVLSNRKYILSWFGGANYYLTEFDKDLCEVVKNKVDSISAESTNFEYPSAKCVYDNLQNYQISNYANKTIVSNGRINADGTLNIATSSAFRILGLIDLSVLDPEQAFFYKGITITETSSHAQLYYRYLASDGETIVEVGQLKTSEQLTIPDNAQYLQFGISVNDITSFIVKVSNIQQDDLKNADKSLRFAVFSDLHYGVGEDDTQRVQELYNTIVDEMITSHLDFVIFNGDMVDCHNTTKDPDAEYQYLYENLISKIKCPIFFTLGNHDGVASVKTLEKYYLKGVQCSMETDMFYFVFLNSYYLGSRETNVPKKWAYDGVDTTFAQNELNKAAALNKIPIVVIHQLGDYSSDTVIDELLANFDTKIVIYSHTHRPFNANRTTGYYINPGCFLDNAKTYALCEMTTNAFKSTIVDLMNNTRTSVNVFTTVKNDSANIVFYKDKNNI